MLHNDELATSKNSLDSASPPRGGGARRNTSGCLFTFSLITQYCNLCISIATRHSAREYILVDQPRVRPEKTMFRRKANTTLSSSRRWLSHRSSAPHKFSSSYALTRNAAVVVATSLAAVAAATIASQKFFNEGPIHNDAYASSIKTSVKELRAGGRDGNEDELRLLVWGSNRCVLLLLYTSAR